MILFLYWILSIFKNGFWKKNILSKHPFLGKKNCQEKKKKNKNCQKLPQLLTVWKGASVFLLSYFEFRQICLNIFIYHHHLSNITNVFFEHCTKYATNCYVTHPFMMLFDSKQLEILNIQTTLFLMSIVGA
jgi:hypothetical protein